MNYLSTLHVGQHDYESDFWLHLLHDNGYLDDKQFESLDKDLTRILKILTSIVKTMRKKLGYDKDK